MAKEQQQLFKDMTADEQFKYLTDLTTFANEKLPLLEQVGDVWEQCHVKSMREGLALINAFQFARDFVEKSLRYGDFNARVKRVRFYVELIQKKVAEGQAVRGADGSTFALVPPLQSKTARRGRPASAETIARREAEAKAKQQQTELELQTKEEAPQPNDSKLSTSNSQSQTDPVPFIAPNAREEADYKLSVAQIRGFLSPDLQRISDNIRALRTSAGAAAQKAKTMAELKTSKAMIAPVAEEAQRTIEQINAIYAAIDLELAEIWFRLQNGSPEWKEAWLKRFGFKSADDLHPDLKSDLKKHYKKVTEAQPDFDARMRERIEEEDPAFIARKKEEADKKKEVQDILKYLRRKDGSQKPETARAKFARLQELLGKKEAAAYKPLLQKIISPEK